MYEQFHALFPSEGPKPYDQHGVREIETFRKTFGGILFIDRILKALGIGEGKAYPPKGESGLRSLHQQICGAKVSSHPKMCVFYYLLLDHDNVRGSRSQLADDFAATSGLPKSFQMLMCGLWHMDRQQFRFALEHLAHPSLPSEFADDIILVLVRHAEPGDYSLPLAYYHAAQPVLQSSVALRLLFDALAQTSITEAFYFARKYPEHVRQQLFESLVAAVLDDDRAVGARARELVSLPLDGAEDRWLWEFLTAGNGRRSRNARQVIGLRNIVTGGHRGSVGLRMLGGEALDLR